MKDWIVILWNYGYHCNEFDVEEVHGPFSEEGACKFVEVKMSEHRFHIISMQLTKGK